MALWRLLARQGIRSTLRIGVDNPVGRLEAHAWLEVDGEIIGDEPNLRRRFALLSAAPETVQPRSQR